ncbi:MAG: PEGA domain-containing protein [Myxococcota bacterium]
MKRRKHLVSGTVWIGVGLLVLQFAGPVAAQEEPENPDAARDARAHFEAGMGHYEQRRFREAIREFRLADALVQSADLSFNIARAHEALNEFADAVVAYQEYLRRRVDPPDRARVEALIEDLTSRAEAARLARQRRPTTGTVEVESSQSGAAVQVGDQAIGQTPIAAPLRLAPGEYRLSVTQDGFIPFESEVQVDAGGAVAAYARLRPQTEYRAVRGNRIFTWIVGGLAIAAAGAGIAFGVISSNQENDGDFDASLDSATISDVFVGSAIALGIGAVLLYFLEGRSIQTEEVTPP